jgi:hypothetical protein
MPSDAFALGRTSARGSGIVAAPIEPRLTTPLIGSAGDGRYVAARPAHIFGSASRRSLFGDGPTSDPTLDDTILGYLAEGVEEE